jgi:hypothetical protein
MEWLTDKGLIKGKGPLQVVSRPEEAETGPEEAETGPEEAETGPEEAETGLVSTLYYFLFLRRQDYDASTRTISEANFNECVLLIRIIFLFTRMH